MDIEAAYINLDRLAAVHAQAIVRIGQQNGENAKELGNTVTKALGVLQEDSVYAFTLFLLSRNPAETRRARIVLDQSFKMLEGPPFSWGQVASDDPLDLLAFVSGNLADNLEPFLLAKEVLEQMLIYARYGAQAWERGGDAVHTNVGEDT